MEGTGADRKVAARTPEEMDKLRRVIAGAVGVDTARGDTMTLEELPFNDQFATDVTRELDVQQKHDYWWELARNSVYPALGLVALFVLLRLFKRTPVQEIPIGVPVGRLVGGITETETETETAMATAMRRVTAKHLSRSPAS